MLWNQSVSDGSAALDGTGEARTGAGGATGTGGTIGTGGATGAGGATGPGGTSSAGATSGLGGTIGAGRMASGPGYWPGAGSGVARDALSRAGWAVPPAAAVCSVHCVPSHQRSGPPASTGSSYQPGAGISMQAPTQCHAMVPLAELRTSATS